MRKDETARSQWSETLVGECAARQREIVGNLWPALRPGGYMIYSTCTFNRKENEEIVEGIVEATGAEIVEVGLPAGCGGIVVRDGMMRFLPSRLLGEGLFMAVLRKRDDDVPADRQGGSKKPGNRKTDTRARSAKRSEPGRADKLVSDAVRCCRDWISGDYGFMVRGDEICAFANDRCSELSELEGNLDVIYRGIMLGTVKGSGVVPSQALAMSLQLNGGAFPSAEVDGCRALCYLRRESLAGFDAPKGHLLLTHGGYPLGFVNNLVNRSNNLYPAAWRILK